MNENKTWRTPDVARTETQLKNIKTIKSNVKLNFNLSGRKNTIINRGTAHTHNESAQRRTKYYRRKFKYLFVQPINNLCTI